MPNSNLPVDEAQRRMPALGLIEDAGIRTETLELAACAPEYFWNVPASTHGYHHPICQKERGLWAHTLMVASAIDRLVDSYEQRGLITGDEPDYARSAAILHDMRKNGDPDSPSSSSVSDHDMRMASVIREHSTLPDEIANAVETHMGPWYDGPEPEHPLDDLVHNADMMASTPNATLAVPGPVPEELAAIGVTAGDF